MIVCIWRNPPTVKRSAPAHWLNNADFKGLYGHLAFGWNIIAGFEKAVVR